MADGAGPPDLPLGDRQLAHMRDVRRILKFLATDERIAPLRSRIVVFGSAARGKACPGDVDAYVDVSDFRGSVQHPAEVEGANLLLQVARQFPGTFDPFVQVGKLLYARNDHATGWTDAKGIRNLRRGIAEDGRTPERVYEAIRTRPYALGGAPAPKPVPEPEPAAPAP